MVVPRFLRLCRFSVIQQVILISRSPSPKSEQLCIHENEFQDSSAQGPLFVLSGIMMSALCHCYRWPLGSIVHCGDQTKNRSLYGGYMTNDEAIHARCICMLAVEHILNAPSIYHKSSIDPVGQDIYRISKTSTPKFLFILLF